MVDNVAITAGSGTTIAADDIGAGVLAQRVKPVWGPDGTGNDTDTASGKSFPVQVRSSTGLIPIGEPTDAANTATNTTSVTAISIWKQISASVQTIATSVSFAAATSGGLSVSSVILASGTNATNVKASAGQIYKIECFNNSANIAYLKIYNTAGTPTAGSGTPFSRYLIPGNASGAGLVTSYEVGDALGTGIDYTVTGGIADADTASVAASAFIVNIHYK